MRARLQRSQNSIVGGALSILVDSRRPSRAEIEPAALDLVRRRGAEILSTARRYAATPEDAEDAYQRGLEILLTKAPSVREDDLVPWLKTVVKHEAFSLYRQRERHTASVSSEAEPPDTHDHVERLERLQVGAEAMSRLKPHEARCIVLLAEGHSYKQIQELTGFSYTKVNRCLTEGRRSFKQRVERIESGAECERLAPLLSAVADGEATARDLAVLRPHLRTCLSCRAALRDARAAPAPRVAALAPIGLLFRWLHDRASAVFLRAHAVAELASAHKLAAAASVAALGGGGIATVEAGVHASRHHARPAAVVQAAAVRPAGSAPAQRAPARNRPPAAKTEPLLQAAPKRKLKRDAAERRTHEAEAPQPAVVEPAARISAPATGQRDSAAGGGTTGEFGP